MNPSSESPAPPPFGESQTLPPGTGNAFRFSFFNAVSFQIMMGAPIILYAKSLGASSTVLGIIAAFTPLMTIFQLPATRFLERYSYKRFVLMGWGLRTVFIFIVAAIPILGFLDNATKMALLLAALFLFNLLRGISSAAWLPWITALVPASVRGSYLSRDQTFMHAGCLFSLICSAIVMTGRVDDGDYLMVFLISAIGGSLSLFYIRRIPEVVAEDAVRRSAQRVPWREIITYPPFLRLVIFNLGFVLVVGSLGVFSVEYLREFPGFSVSKILLLSALSFIGALVTLQITGRFLDETGSKPVLFFAQVLFGVVILGWCLMAAQVIPAKEWLVGILTFLSGVASANFGVANTRISMATMPEMGRNHFFALFTVISSLGLGISPVAWGLLLDAIGSYEIVGDWFTAGRHSIYFAIIFLFNLGTFALIPLLYEPGRGMAPEPNLVYARLKRSSRHWQR